jgi:hypothetical protein
MIEIQRILCPIDYSDYSRHALDHAVALARRVRVNDHGPACVLHGPGGGIRPWNARL